MHLVVAAIWIIAGVLLAIAALTPRPFTYANAAWGGVFCLNLWIGLHFLIETTDYVRI